MTDGEAYAKAARLLERHGSGYSCDWLASAAYSDDAGAFDVTQEREVHLYALKQRYADYFCPQGRGIYDGWFGASTPANVGPRVLALCFMAAIAESEDA